jgi:hypothetical protein
MSPCRTDSGKEEAMYGFTDPERADAYRVTARDVRDEQAREAAIAERMDTIADLLAKRPLTAVVPARYTTCAQQDLAVIAADMCGWVNENIDGADLVLARAMFDPAARQQLIEQYALARASAEVDRPLQVRRAA